MSELARDIVFDSKRYWAPFGSVAPPAGLPDVSRYKNHGVFGAGAAAPTWVQEPSGIWTLNFDGTDDIVTVGNIAQSIKSCLLWIRPDDNTSRSIVDFDAGTHSIELSAGAAITATGWAAPIIYVNGVVAAAIAQSIWHCVAVTTATAFLVSAFILGQEASFYDGKIGFVTLFLDAIGQDVISKIYQSQRYLFGV